MASDNMDTLPADLCPKCGLPKLRKGPGGSPRRYGNEDWCQICYTRYAAAIRAKRWAPKALEKARLARQMQGPKPKKPAPLEIKCRTCGEVKPRSEFWKYSNGKPQTECKPCMKARTHKWTQDNRERFREIWTRSTRKRRQRKYEAWTLSKVKNRAAKAGIEFSLTVDDIVIPDVCPVLGIRLRKQAGSEIPVRGIAARDHWPSVDRIDNSKGYTPDNIIIVSYRANRLKSDATIGEMRRIADFYESLTRRRARKTTVSGMHSDQLHWEEEFSVSGM